MSSFCNCTDLNRITGIVDALVKENAEEKAHLANQWWVIVLAYSFVILPWGFLFNWDFITEQWRTMKETRLLSGIHLAVAILPMPFIMYYAHLQQRSQDHKEMMTAVVAILTSMYHVLRTIWGIFQLKSFTKWCSVLRKRMGKMNMDTLMDLDSIEGDDADSSNSIRSEGILEDLENMRVNNTIVDNELGGTDLNVNLGIVGGNPRKWEWIKTGQSQLCTVRWSGAFLSAFGEFWYGRREREIVEELFANCPASLRLLESLTFPVRKRKLCFRYIECTKSGPYNSEPEIDQSSKNKLNKIPNSFKTRKRELENLMGSFPSDGNDLVDFRHVEMRLVCGLQLAECMDDEAFDSLVHYNTKLYEQVPHNSSEWSLLLWKNRELSAALNPGLMEKTCVPPFPWRNLTVPVWDSSTNWRVLQASVHSQRGKYTSGKVDPCSTTG